MADYSEIGYVSSPVTVDDVGDYLGETSKVVKDLCESDNINMWARYKPFIATGKYAGKVAFKQDTDASKTDRDEALSLANHGLVMCGVTRASISSIPTNIISKYDGNMNGWKYNGPAGGASEPYRLADFYKYQHDAVQPFASLSINFDQITDTANYINVNRTINISATSIESTDPDRKNLIYSDLGTLANGYFGVLFYDENSNYRRAEARETVGDSGGLMRIKVQASTIVLSKDGNDETWNVVPYIRVASTSSEGVTSYIYYTIPFFNVMEMTIRKSQEHYVEIKAIKTYSSLTSCEVTVYNTVTGTITIKDATIFFRHSGKKWSDARESDEVLVHLTDATYSTTKQIVYNDTPSLDESLLKDLVIWFRGNINGETSPTETYAVAMMNQDDINSDVVEATE